MSAAPNSRRQSVKVPAYRDTLRRATGRDGNPLCRPVDRARSRLQVVLIAGLVLSLAVSAMTAVLLLDGMRAQAREVAVHRHQVTATTTAVGADPVQGSAPAPASWSYPGATRHSGTVGAPAASPAGTRLPVWVDDHGNLATAPAPDSRLAATAATYGIGVLLVGASTVCAAHLVRRRSLDRRAEGTWEPEWEQVEPFWSGRRRPSDSC